MSYIFKKPYRVGKRQDRAVLDADGREVVVFPRGMEAWAKDYCIHLNTNNQPEVKEDEPRHMPGEPNRFVLALYIVFVVIPAFLYRYFTRKAFYVSGTFLNADGVRMFFKTTFCTYGNVMPIKSLEKKCAMEFDVDGVSILNFNRIPYGMVKYMEMEMDVTINMR